jgi:hypothetical protein
MAESDTPALPEDVEAASRAVEDWCRVSPGNFEPFEIMVGFGPPSGGSVTVSYLRADREVTLIEPLSLSKYSQQDVDTPLPYVHIYEECPSVKAALRRDGEVLRSRAPVDAFLNPPAAQPCGWCLRKWNG